MKTKLIFTILFFLVTKYSIIEGQEVWHENIYIPSEYSQSAPHSIIYNEINNMIYVYTGQKIIYLSKTSGIIQGSMVVGETGYFSSRYSTIKRTNKLAFDPLHNRIFCTNEDDELLVIDCSDADNPEIIQEFSSPLPLESSFLFFNPEIDRLYWVQNSLIESSASKLVVINTNSFTIDGNFSTSPQREIFDVAFCHQNDYISLSVRSKGLQGAFGDLSLLDAHTLVVYDAYVFSDKEPNKLVYVGEANRLYCLTTNADKSNANLISFLVNPSSNQLIYQPDHSINDFPIYESESTCYIGGTTHYIYIPGKPVDGSSNKLVILDYIEPINGTPIVEEFELAEVDQVLVNTSTNRVYSSGKTINRIFQTEIEYSVSTNGIANHLIQVGIDRIAISNIEGNSVDLFSMMLVFDLSTNLGVGVLKGIYNSISQKIYWLGEFTESAISNLTVQNISNNTLSSIPIGRSIYDFAFHQGSEKLIIAHHDWENSFITIIDGQSNDIQEVPSNHVNRLHSGIGDFTYIGGNNILEYINMTTLAIGQVQNNQMANYHIIDFELLSNGNCLALATEDGIWGCRLVEIDKTSNSIIRESHTLDIYPQSQGGLIYNAYKNQIYLLSDYSLTIISPITYSIIETIYTSNKISECLYSPFSDKIIICSGNSKILFFKGSTFEFLKEVLLPNLYTYISSFYNQFNNRLYVQAFGWDNLNNQQQIHLLVYQCDNNQLISNIYLHQNQTKWTWEYTPYARMVLDENNNYLYVPNQGLGNISKVECPPDKIPLQARVWNWISIPRLDQANSPVPAQPILAEIQMFPDTLRMTNLELKSNPDEKYISNNYGTWSGDLANVQSTFGYKLKHSEPTTCYLPMIGELPDPATTFTITRAMKIGWVISSLKLRARLRQFQLQYFPISNPSKRNIGRASIMHISPLILTNRQPVRLENGDVFVTREM